MENNSDTIVPGLEYCQTSVNNWNKNQAIGRV